MDEAALVQYITTTFPAVETTDSFGYTMFFYGPDRKLPFATLISADTDYDRLSSLDRPGVFRLNIGVSPATFRALFGSGRVTASDYDFTAVDQVMPHPDYAAQSWLCVLTPSAATAEQVRAFLADAYERAAHRQRRRRAEE